MRVVLFRKQAALVKASRFHLQIQLPKASLIAVIIMDTHQVVLFILLSLMVMMGGFHWILPQLALFIIIIKMKSPPASSSPAAASVGDDGWTSDDVGSIIQGPNIRCAVDNAALLISNHPVKRLERANGWTPTMIADAEQRDVFPEVNAFVFHLCSLPSCFDRDHSRFSGCPCLSSLDKSMLPFLTWTLGKSCCCLFLMFFLSC